MNANMRYCTGCGEHIYKNAKVCPKCGKKQGSSNMKFIAISSIVVIITIALVITFSRSVELVITNNTDEDIEGLFIRSTGAAGWGKNLLMSGEILRDGRNFTVKHRLGLSNKNIDVLLIEVDAGSIFRKTNINPSSQRNLVFTDDDWCWDEDENLEDLILLMLGEERYQEQLDNQTRNAITMEVAQHAIMAQAWFRIPRMMGGGGGSFTADDFPSLLRTIDETITDNTLRTPSGVYVFGRPSTTAPFTMTITGSSPTNQRIGAIRGRVNLNSSGANQGITIEVVSQLDNRTINAISSQIAEFAVDAQGWFRAPRMLGGGGNSFGENDLTSIMRYINQGNHSTTITIPSGQYVFARGTGTQIVITGTSPQRIGSIRGIVNLDGSGADQGITIQHVSN